MFGLTSEDLQVIVHAIKSYPQIEEAVIFGSRALNTHKKGSDVDIVLKGKNLDTIATELGGRLNEESPLPYFFDVLDYNLIDNPDLKDHINRVGVAIYHRRP